MRGIFRTGDPFVWLTAGALAASLLMVSALIFLIATRALGFFWPAKLLHVHLADGSEALGEVWVHDGRGPAGPRIKLKVGNRDIYGADFRWIDETAITSREYPAGATAVERMEWGNLYGFVQEVRHGDRVVASGTAAAWAMLQARLPEAQARARRIRRLREVEIGLTDREIERIRLELRQRERGGTPDEQAQALRARVTALSEQVQRAHAEVEVLSRASELDRVAVRLADGAGAEVALDQIVRAYRPNAMTVFQKTLFSVSRLWEFASGEPREANTEGGVFPAIFGTVLMVLIMSIAVVPFGVVTAVYLSEYGRPRVLATAVRVAVTNLAGVPSIVFGVFGLGFFIYWVGGGIDALFFSERLPAPTFGTGGILWAALTLALLTLPVVVVATEEALATVPREAREGSLALGATQFETVWRVVLPQALPGVLTGLILAVGRAAGEVAPLMLTGVVKLAPALPVDQAWPYLHLERKFMHLAFYIYDVGFQSPNVEAAKPMLYASTLLLVSTIFVLNLTAILVRARLRRRLTVGAA